MADPVNDFHYENFLCDIASNEQIELVEFYSINQNSIHDFTRKYNKMKLYYIVENNGFEFTCQDEHKFNPDELLPLIVNDGYL